jgi:hypothetical protein
MKGPGKPSGTQIKWDTTSVVYADAVTILWENMHTIKENIET